MGPGRVWLGTGYSPPTTHPPYPYPGYTPSTPWLGVTVMAGSVQRVEEVVGLRSVAQLTLDAHFSVLRTMTEVYNLF